MNSILTPTSVEIGNVPFADLARHIALNDSKTLRKSVHGKFHELQTHQHWLTIDQFVSAVRHLAPVTLAPNLLHEDGVVVRSCQEVQGYLSDNNKRLIYGVNTGFGSARSVRIPSDQAAELSYNILYSHATGVGQPLAPEIVRGMLLLRLKTFAQGCSGVRPEVLLKLVEFLNKWIIPVVPEKGSVGSSGDLAPLSHLALALIGKGKYWIVTDAKQVREPLKERDAFDGETLEAKTGIKPLKLSAKDGLALTNGATVSAAMLALAVYDAEHLFHRANQSGAMTLQAACGHTRAIEALPHAARPHLGQILAAKEIAEQLQGSTLVDRVAAQKDAQDDYSIRAMPQVHGAAYTAILHTRHIAETEINSITDNPLFFGHLGGKAEIFSFDQAHLKPGKWEENLDTTHCSAANFHGEPVGMAADYLKIAVAELANIAERRIQLLLDSHHNRGLPANLVAADQGLNSGYMIAQYAAASLVADNKVLCHPSSVDSIPTSANAEDHVAMATNAARHSRMVIENTAHVLAIELLCALQAVELRIDLINGDKAKLAIPDKDLQKLLNENAAFASHQTPQQSPRSAALHQMVRSDLRIPFIYSDSGTDKTKPSFEQHPPSELIAKLASFIREIS